MCSTEQVLHCCTPPAGPRVQALLIFNLGNLRARGLGEGEGNYQPSTFLHSCYNVRVSPVTDYALETSFPTESMMYAMPPQSMAAISTRPKVRWSMRP